jgi:hypothetical protein
VIGAILAIPAAASILIAFHEWRDYMRTYGDDDHSKAKGSGASKPKRAARKRRAKPKPKPA